MKKILFVLLGVCAVCCLFCSCTATRTVEVIGRTTIITSDTTFVKHGGNLDIRVKK